MKKKAILSISFGVKDQEMMKRNLDKLEEDYADLYPDFKIYRALTNETVVEQLRDSGNDSVYAVREVMARMVLDDVSYLYAQPAYILNGTENDALRNMIFSHAADFINVECGAPLLTTHEDFERTCNALMEGRDMAGDEAIVFIGHGSRHYSNAVYCAMDYTLKDMGYANAHMATFNAYPKIDTVIGHLKKDGIKKVTVEPFMFVAGDSALNGVCGSGENSMKSRLSAEGFETKADIRCLGEFKAIRDIYTDHLKACIK